jgi:hypothetical protein
MAVVSQQLPPHVDVPVFHLGQLPVDLRSVGIPFGPSQFPVQVRSVSLVF